MSICLLAEATLDLFLPGTFKDAATKKVISDEELEVSQNDYNYFLKNLCSIYLKLTLMILNQHLFSAKQGYLHHGNFYENAIKG